LIKFTDMELKHYDKPWLPAIKGVFLIIFGILCMLSIAGTIVSFGVLFAFLIALTGFLLIATGVISKKSRFRIWSIVSGALNLVFFVYLVMHVDKGLSLAEARKFIIMTIFLWVMFYAITELIEAGLLVSLKNAFASVFAINALLTFTFGYFLYVVTENVTPQSVFRIGIFALVVGIVNELSAYLLSRIKE
jgi:uncharacterized membrane protein HdeD (DUF308 family)